MRMPMHNQISIRQGTPGISVGASVRLPGEIETLCFLIGATNTMLCSVEVGKGRVVQRSWWLL